MAGVANHERRAAQNVGQSLRQRIDMALLATGAPENPQPVVTENPLRNPAHLQAQLRVVSQLRMQVERKVIRQQIDIGLDQLADATPLEAGDRRRLTLPEVPVMDEDRVGARRDRRIDERIACGDARDEGLDVGPSFHLQAVWAIIANLRHIEKIVEIARERGQFHGAILVLADSNASRPDPERLR